MKGCLIALGVVFLLAVVGVVGFCSFITGVGDDMKPVANEALTAMAEGRYQDVYDGATQRFRDKTSLETLTSYGEARRRALGAYRGIDSTTGINVSSNDSGTTGELKLTVDYEKGSTTATVDLEKVGEEWKLLGLTLDIPESLAPKADPADLEPLARELIGMMSDKKLVALYDRFEPELKANWEAGTFQEQMLGLANALGPVKTATLVSNEQDDEGYHHLRFKVAFEKAEKDVRVKLFERDGRWGVFAFFVGDDEK